MSIFDIVKNSFGHGLMETSPSVMEDGTRVIDPMAEAAARQYAQNVPPIREVPPTQEAISLNPMDQLFAGMMGGNSGGIRDYGNQPAPAPQMTPEDELMAQPVVPSMTPEEAQWADMTPEDYQETYGVPPVPEDTGEVPEPGDPMAQGYDKLTPEEIAELHAPKYAGPTGADDNKKPSVTDDMTNPVDETDPDITPEEAVEITKVIDEVPDDKVPTGAATKEEAKAVAAEDPKGFKKAMNWFTKTFGITGQDLARTALLYAGSRLAGYDHSGSMTFAYEATMGDVQTREAYRQQLINSGKYSPKSIEEFKKTGDAGKLVVLTTPGKATKRDLTKPYVDSTGKRYYETTDPDGNKGFTDAGGNLYKGNDALKELKAPETRAEIIDEYGDSASSTLSDVLKNSGAHETVKGKRVNPNIQIVPEVAGRQVVEIILDQMDGIGNSENLNSGLYTRVAQNAMQAAERHSRATGEVVDDITPFVIAEIQYYEGTEQWQRDLNRDGEKLSVEDWDHIKNNVLGRDSEEFKALIAKGYKEDYIINHVMTQQYQEFLKDVPKEKRGPDAFWRYMLNRK